ncbi:MAG: transglutaminase domain-containing protein [Candidatus Neomarinimicrobiota bacterium]
MSKLSAFFLLVVLFVFPAVLTPFTGEVITSFPTPAGCPTGLEFDGKNLWLADRKTDTLYCINPENGKVIQKIASPGYWPMGLAWDGKSLWCSDNHDGKIYQINPKDGTILRTVDAPGGSSRDIVWDGKYLWCVDDGSDEIIQFNSEDGTTIKSLKSPAGDPRGLAFDGRYLWISDRIKDEIYMVDPASGSVVLIADAPGPYTKGLAFDGKSLWAVDYQNDKIYKLKIRDGEKFKTSDARKAKVTFTHQVRNFGPGAIKSVDVHIAIPEKRDNQTLNTELTFNPKPTDFVTDRWGQKTAHFIYKNIKSGKPVETMMTADATVYKIRYFLYPDLVGNLDEIPLEISEKYLENNEKYQFDHPTIQNAVREAVGEEKNTYWIARRIFDYINQKMFYERVGGWNTAPTVLARGNGSCSEYTFVYIAMCRAAGIPARYVGSVVVRGDDASMDDVFHRWVEVYFPGYGWIPVDPSGGDNELPRDQAAYFGALANRFLITTQSGGGSETMGWTYNSNEFWSTEPQTKVVIETIAEWEPEK